MSEENRTIYLIEDEPQQREVLALLLESEGFNVRSVGSAEEGLDMLHKNHPPSLIVSDVKLTGMDGFTFFDQVRAQERNSSIPFIFITGYNDPRAIEKLESLSNVSYITKPYEIEDFIKRIHTILPQD